MKRLFLTDKEVASIAEISVKTLSRICLNPNFFAKMERRSHRLRDSAEYVGNVRRWNIHKLASVLGVTEDEILKRIS